MAERAAGGYIAPSGSTKVVLDRSCGFIIPASVARQMSKATLDRLNGEESDDA